MKKLILTSVAALLMSTAAFTQNCNLALNDGVKMTTTVTSYSNTLPYDPKFTGEKKEEKKDEMVAAYNAGILSGQTAGYSSYVITSTFKKSTANGEDQYIINSVMGTTPFSYYLYCRSDTLYSCLYRTPVLVGVDTLNPSGYRIEGPMVLPMNVKVGDLIPAYDDITIGFPVTTDVVAKKKVYAGMVATGGSTETYTYGTDSKTGEQGMGYLSTPNTKAVYNTIDVNVRQTLSYSGHIIHHVHALVTGTEEFSISGKKYTAYIIESEGWSKATLTNNYETEDAQVKKELVAEDQKLQAVTDKLAVKKGWTNALGYNVGFMKEWFVPQIGIVKFEAYDIYGGIMMISTVTGLE